MEFNNIKEMEKFLKNDKYIFRDKKGRILNIKINFDLDVEGYDIEAGDIDAWKIDASSIKIN